MVIEQPCCKTGFASAFECADRTPDSESVPSYLPTPALHRVVSVFEEHLEILEVQ